VVPDVVVGHSQGEIAAACVSGALSVTDALTVVTARSRLLARIAGDAGMLSVRAGADDIAPLLGEGSDVSLAAVNGPTSTVLSGSTAALQGAVDWCEAKGVRTRWVPVDYAAHSAQVEQIRTELGTELAGIAPRPATTLFRSTAVGGFLDGTALDADYWFRNLRDPVRFSDAIEDLAGQGYGCFVEVSPHPVLTMGMIDSLDGTGSAVAGTLRRDDGGMDRFLRSAGEIWTSGASVRWPAAIETQSKSRPPARIELPTYAFAHSDYWATPPARSAAVEHEPAPSEDWRYRIHWKPIEWEPGPGRGEHRLVVVPEEGDQEWIDSVLEVLRNDGPVTVITVGVGDGRGDVAAAVVGAL
ncbi:acyltransferase domain-containing protein, partial [Streptomonospora sediminis]